MVTLLSTSSISNNVIIVYYARLCNPLSRVRFQSDTSDKGTGHSTLSNLGTKHLPFCNIATSHSSPGHDSKTGNDYGLFGACEQVRAMTIRLHWALGKPLLLVLHKQVASTLHVRPTRRSTGSALFIIDVLDKPVKTKALDHREGRPQG